jgi:hypothetical protein
MQIPTINTIMTAAEELAIAIIVPIPRLFSISFPILYLTKEDPVN